LPNDYANFARIGIAALAVACAPALLPVASRSETASATPLVVPVVIGDGPGMLIPLVLQSAELDGEQSSDAFQLVEAEGSAIRERLKQIARLDVELAKRIFAAGRPPAQAELAPILKRMATLRQEIVDREVAILLRIRGGLKPEQRAAVTAMEGQLLRLVSQLGSEGLSGDTP
jgi:hypothetical protein